MGICRILATLVVVGGVLGHVHAEAKEGHDGDERGTWRNVALGFGLVMLGATLSTLGAAMLYLDRVIRKVTSVGQDFSLAKSEAFLASSLSFSAGVLAVTVFCNLLPEGVTAFETSDLFGASSGVVAASYFGGCMLVVAGVKGFVRRRHTRAKHIEAVRLEKDGESSDESSDEADPEEAMKRVGYEIALALALHNFPEGVVTFVAAYKSMRGGLLFGTALALHKFPEGIMVGVPILAGTGSKWKAVAITAAASYLTQLLGALFAFFLSTVFWNDIIAGLLFLLAAAILITTLFGGILPLARQYDKNDRYSGPWLGFGVTLFVLLTSMLD